MELGLKDKVAIVTGGSSGIGRAAVLAFAQAGARVVATYRSNGDGAEATAREARLSGAEVVTGALDLADTPALAGLVDATAQRWGGVDILVNSAVDYPPFPAPGQQFEDAPAEWLARSLTSNLLGPYTLSQAAVRHMRRAGGGRIVYLSSTFVEDGYPGRAPYVAAKSGLHGLARVMSRELARAGILTNVVIPGFTPGDKPQSQGLLQLVQAATATRRVTTPEEVANTILFLCSQANSNITGQVVRVDGHFMTPAP